MLELNIPDDSNSITDLEIALKYKNGTYKYKLSDKEKKEVKKIYKKYHLKQGEPHDDFKSILLEPQTNQAINDAYNEIQISGRLNKLRNTILLSSEFCPYCGISVPDEIDHYLPKSKYMAMSAYIRNLIPICHTCNNNKRTAENKGNGNTFFHAYYEKFPSTPFFIAVIDFTDKILTVDFTINENDISENLKNKLNFQISRSKLGDRLNKQINILLFNNYEAFSTIYEYSGKNGVINLITKKYKQCQNAYGNNFWQTAFLLALSQCHEFCNGGFYDYYKALKKKK